MRWRCSCTAHPTLTSASSLKTRASSRRGRCHADPQHRSHTELARCETDPGRLSAQEPRHQRRRHRQPGLGDRRCEVHPHLRRRGWYLQATATYTDGQGTAKTARAATTDTVKLLPAFSQPVFLTPTTLPPPTVPPPPPTPAFVDVPVGSVHAGGIAAVAVAGITRGCDSVGPRFCPDQPVTRAQMATFLTRALELPTHIY